MKNLPDNHPVLPKPKIGVLIINLGTPEATDYLSMRKYLKEFLSDKRVIEIPSILWKPILNLFILTFRPKKSGKLYDKIWDKNKNESPLKIITREQKEKLKFIYKEDKVKVEWAMRYGKPSIFEKMNMLTDNGCNRILIFPLYPQYSASTTASVMDKVNDFMYKKRWQPTIRTVPPYYDNPIYINSLIKSIKKHIKKLTWVPDTLICSFHGIPKKYFMKGDPYHCQCVKTQRLIKEQLKKEFNNVDYCFQSRFGPQEWLQPYMVDKFKELIKNNQKKICVITPGFASDCLETLEEIKIQSEKEFLECGGEKFSYIPCLNSTDISINMLDEIIKKELKGWI